MITAKELADILDAEDRLLNRGYVKTKCETCKGAGKTYKIQTSFSDPLVQNCFKCEGRGYHWNAPITK